MKRTLPKARLLRRPPVQRDYIASAIRREIVEGRLMPGAKLPTYQELLRRYGTAPNTIHSAIGRLFSEGFIERRPRQGVFVAARPPHLSRYGLIFRHRPHAGQQLDSFLQAMLDEAKRDRARQIEFLYEVDPFYDHDRQEYHDLLETVLNDGVAGLVFTANPQLLLPTPVIQKPGLPRVAVMSKKEHAGIAAVYVDYRGWMERALDAVAARGCKRVALLATPGIMDWTLEQFRRGVASRGMSSAETWTQCVHYSMGKWVQPVVRAVMAGAARSRPDALLVAEDALVEHATLGLREAGLRAPQDVYVVAHTNFPILSPAAVPVDRLGFDARRVLHTCWDLIDLQRQGRPEPKTVQWIPAIFENEFKEKRAPLAAAAVNESSHASAD